MLNLMALAFNRSMVFCNKLAIIQYIALHFPTSVLICITGLGEDLMQCTSVDFIESFRVHKALPHYYSYLAEK